MHVFMFVGLTFWKIAIIIWIYCAFEKGVSKTTATHNTIGFTHYPLAHI